MAGFLPKQAKAFLDGQNKVTTYEETGGKVTAEFASHVLTLIPPIPAGSIIHDNTSGAGTVSRKILATTPDVKIYATDNDQPFLDVLQKDVDANSWPIEVSNQDSNALSFPDETFTHSITNIGIFFTGSAGLDGAKEIYRTLKPGGIAVVNCWQSVTWLFPIVAVHKVLRPGKPFPAPTINWSDGVQIQKIMKEAGFAEENTRVETSEAWAKTSDLRAWAEKTWAFLAGIGVWQESDEERWDEAVDLMVEKLKESQGVKIVEGETWLKASEWVVVATK
jgi:ubiquinone/menaquinone biosynthesis C-methylase UbiE